MNETPDFATHPASVLPAQDDRETPAAERETGEDKKYKDALLCSQTFDVCMKGCDSLKKYNREPFFWVLLWIGSLFNLERSN